MAKKTFGLIGILLSWPIALAFTLLVYVGTGSMGWASLAVACWAIAEYIHVCMTGKRWWEMGNGH